MSDIAYAKVAVVITSYNRPTLLKRAIKSAASQTYKNIEIIVVDGGSDSDIEALVHELNDNRLVFLQAGRKSNVSIARDLGAKLTTADYLSFLDDDDELLPKKIEQQMELFKQASNDIGVVYCGQIDVLEDGAEICHPASIRGNVLGQILSNNFVAMGSANIKRDYI
ncbi:MAG: glycosyltransferase family A protein [Methanomassiliicoccales archaeon]|nr:glycosyltransferase family A protein [Methanomassiliicoccales archaeon]